MKSKTLFFTLAIVLTALLTAWQLSTPAQAADKNTILIYTTTIHADGSGEYRYEYNGDLVKEIDSTVDIVENCTTNAGDASTSKIETRDGVKWCVSTGTFDTTQELADIHGSYVSELEIRDETLYFDLNIDLSGSFDLEKYNIEWRVVAPGKIVDHNADKVSGCTLTWTLDSNDARNLHLESKTDGVCKGGLITVTGNKWVIVGFVAVCCCMLLVVVIGVVVFFVMKKKNQQPRM
jgi:hypothetical protein